METFSHAFSCKNLLMSPLSFNLNSGRSLHLSARETVEISESDANSPEIIKMASKRVIKLTKKENRITLHKINKIKN